MLTTDPQTFLRSWRELPAAPWGAATARMAVLMTPDGLSASAITSADNRYMQTTDHIDCDRVHDQHRELARALAQELPVCIFPGDVSTPDAAFLNNAFATVPGRLILGAMRYPERQRETRRNDVRAFFTNILGYVEADLFSANAVAELTGSLVIDRRRGVGFCGLGERCDLTGARAMHEAFGLRLTYAFDLASGEYHTNVVMSVLAGKTLILCREGIVAEAASVLMSAYGDNAVPIALAEKDAFVGNCIALREGSVWMSARAAGALSPASRNALTVQGWRVCSVDLSEIEKAGGSLRCCVAEVF